MSKIGMKKTNKILEIMDGLVVVIAEVIKIDEASAKALVYSGDASKIPAEKRQLMLEEIDELKNEPKLKHSMAISLIESAIIEAEETARYNK